MKKFLFTCVPALSLVLAFAGALRADEEAKPLLKKEDKLTEDDPKDKLLKQSYAKSYTFKLEAGQGYRIEMNSTEVDSFLRLEDPSGTNVAADDDSGGNFNAQIVYKAKEDGEHKIIATTYGQPMGSFKLTGAFTVAVYKASALDLLELQVREIAKAGPLDQKKTIRQVKTHLEQAQKKLTPRESRMATQVAFALERRKAENASEVYGEFGKILAGATDLDVASQGRMLQGCVRRLALVGTKMEVKGKTMDGKEFDLAKLKGKVVLVDFWATWCGPCIREMPNMKKAYETYKDRGFEIIGINTDKEREATEKFLAKRNLPWPSIHDVQVDGKTLAETYGVMFIPLPILVDRDGKVLSLEARGPELEALLEKHLSATEK